MAALSIYLDTRRPKKDGTYPLKFNISINRGKKFLIGLNIDVTQTQWDGNEVVKHDRRVVLNQYIRMRRTQIEDELLKLEMNGMINILDTDQIKTKIEAIFSRSNDAEKSLLKTHWERFISFKERQSTIESYQQTLLKIGKYNNLDTLRFEEISLTWLREFEQALKKEGLATNTISIHIRNLRSVFNNAIDEEVISQSSYPFRKFKIKSEQTAKRALTLEQLKILKDYPIQKHQEKYRDLFMLIFYMEGINIVDLLYLKTLNNGRADFKRSKTGRLYSIRIEPEAQLIIDKYKGKEYLLDVLDTYSNYRDFRHRMNSNLQSIGSIEMVSNQAKDPKFVKKNKKEITPLFPELTTYWARHTWATIAAGLEIPKETIAAALGHGGNSVTDIYIDFDRKKVDAANRLVIDTLENITAPASE